MVKEINLTEYSSRPMWANDRCLGLTHTTPFLSPAPAAPQANGPTGGKDTNDRPEADRTTTVDGFSSPGEHQPDPPTQAHQIGLLNPVPAPLAPRSATVHVRPHCCRRPTGRAQAPAPAARRRPVGRPVPSYVWAKEFLRAQMGHTA
ncbi:hypothetical protein PtB15_4B477 [Puccinia triticina]|nr:hypothetical protein PtB15_4B477 [Puccinia triticina]